MNNYALLTSKVLSILFFISVTTNSQNQLSKRYDMVESNLFTRANVIYADGNNLANFFPNKIGDFWEFIEEDTTTLFGQNYTLKFSVSREVINDTTMNNGFTYKKIKWQNEANSVNYPPEYEHLRVDSIGNAHIFYDTTDFILFDFTLDINQTYPSHLQNHEWKIMDKYNVIGFGDTLQAMDFGLFEQGTILKDIYTIVENFGIIFYQIDYNEWGLPKGNFWGAVIEGQELGTLIVKKQTVDWKQFYPLHIGDYWVYEGEDGAFPITLTQRCVGDTIMPDGDLYFKLNAINHTFGNNWNSYVRLDSTQKVFIWDELSNSTINILKFSNVIGDTFSFNQMQNVKRLEDKYFNPFTNREELHFFMYPDIVFHNEYYDYSFGLYSDVIELNYTILKGAYINGILWEDTTITSIEDESLTAPEQFSLSQNYPNPFNPSTVISYQLPIAGKVILKVFDVLAKEIATLVNEEKPAGIYNVDFQSIANRRQLANGVYFYQLKTADYVETKKMILLK